MLKMLVLKGLPGCGKSTFAKQLLKEEKGWKRINRDDLRLMLDDGAYSHGNEDFVRFIEEDLIRKALAAGNNVVVDNTNLVASTVKKLHKLAEDVGDVIVQEKGFNVPVEECILRNDKRVGKAKVPTSVIVGMAKKAGLMKGQKLEDIEVCYPAKDTLDPSLVVKQDTSLPSAVICDLDGTLALLNGRNPYDAGRCDEDLPNTPVIECVKAMHAHGRKIVFMSGREEKHREPTVRFIERHVIDPEGRVLPYELYMRETSDTRKDNVVKRELFEKHVLPKHNVLFVLDDRDQVVRGWRNMGIPTFQVAYGAF